MIQKMEISGIHAKVDKTLNKYVEQKIGNLDKYAPKNARASMHAEVKLKHLKAKNKVGHTCEVIIFLPNEQITTVAKATTLLAAVDEAEAKLKIQLKKYKEKHSGPRLHRRALRVVRRKIGV